MKILIDGDGCPVIRETERAASLFGLEVFIFCDTSHLIHSDKSRVILVDQGRDAADWAMMSKAKEGDLASHPGLWPGVPGPFTEGLCLPSGRVAVYRRKYRRPSPAAV